MNKIVDRVKSFFKRDAPVAKSEGEVPSMTSGAEVVYLKYGGSDLENSMSATDKKMLWGGKAEE